MNVEQKLKELHDELEGDKDALKRIEDLAKLYRGDDEVVNVGDIEKYIASLPPEPKMFTGFNNLDKTIDGFRPKQVIVLTGITKHGKTQFAMELMQRMESENPLLIPFEEPVEELIRKFHERGLKVPNAYSPLTTRDRTLDWIEEKIIESKAKFNTKIVFIDHLGYIKDQSAGYGDNRADRIESTMKDIKALAKKWDVIIFVLTHLKKVQLDRNPDLEDIRSSASIAQEADIVMIMWRKTERVDGQIEITNEAVLSIQANRRTGRTGNLHYIFIDGRYQENDDIDLENHEKKKNREDVDKSFFELGK